ncbi:MAG TPA: exopolysaccharide biosynthesis polyprenyl glycosylphosphotransferase [Pirellulales bacterium]|nr:exopolysaccharide biosynthesis polyprenyl glycosylphosphotransferase [Pirellulales bacterium]
MTKDRQDRVIESPPRNGSDAAGAALHRGARGPHFRIPPSAASASPAADGSVVVGAGTVQAQGLGAAAKRALDLVGALAMLAVFGLPMLLVAALIRMTSPGPALYTQERVGLGGRRFMMLKFRTMHLDAEAQTGPVWARDDDPRRTRFGVFLRRWSIDELPQLINVVWGEMSLVGPRPERPYFVARFSRELPDYNHRHGMRPGLTGWAQLNGLRGNTSISKRLEFDLHYIAQWSLKRDLAILLLTPVRMLTDKNAY